MRPGMKQIFISYAHKDQKIAKELTSMLAAGGMKVWLADEQVLPRDNVSLEVGKALEQSDAMVVLLSPDAVASQNVRREIAYALSSPKFEQRLVPVMVKATKNIPWFLENLAPIRLSEALNPSNGCKIFEKPRNVLRRFHHHWHQALFELWGRERIGNFAAHVLRCYGVG